MPKKNEAQDYKELLLEVRSHYDDAKAELQTRVENKAQGFNEYDNLYRSHIDPKKWSFNTKIFIPLSFTSLFAKGTRLITGKIKGKLNATQFGSELGARVGTELLSAQYDDHDFYYEEPMVSKWLRMDQNARKYGAAFALVPWRKELLKSGSVGFDGPTFEVLDNRRVYLQPGCTSVTESSYVIVEREVTYRDLLRINDTATKKGKEPVYKNLDKLKELSETSITREIPSQNAELRGLTNTHKGKGLDKPFRMLTEYRNDTWITWLPDVGGGDKDAGLGLVIRQTDNPYKHGLKPIIRLVYIPIDDDIYGVSELESGRSSQKATNALVSGFVEAVSTELYPVIKGHPTNVDWKTVEFKPRAAWIMNNPATDVVRLEGSVTFIRSFVEAYKLLVGQFSESMGDTTAEVSQLAQLEAGKTATEIKDLALKRGARDNLNKLFLAAAITKMYSMWWEMDKQFLTDKKVIKVSGKEALEYFVKEGLAGWELAEEGYKAIASYIEQMNSVGEDYSFEQAYEDLRQAGMLERYAKPISPIQMNGQTLPKLQMEDGAKSGFLTVNKEDTLGDYRFTVDLNSIGQLNESEEAGVLGNLLKQMQELEESLAKEGYRVKYKEVIEDIAEKLQVHNADQYFEKIDPNEVAPQQMMGMMQQAGGMQPQMGQMPQQQQMPQEQMVDPSMVQSQPSGAPNANL